jgi:hypothetical protein
MNEVKDCFAREGQPGEAGRIPGEAGPEKRFSK